MDPTEDNIVFQRKVDALQRVEDNIVFLEHWFGNFQM
jgi:hypothetical protein